MNTLIRTFNGKYISRPSTSLERGSNDWFVPDFISEITYSPALFARISRPGRCIPERFAGRYFDAVTAGIVFYPENLIDGSSEGFACASCIDHTTFLPLETFGCDRRGIRMTVDGAEVFRSAPDPSETVPACISEASVRTFVRTGDFLGIELSPRRFLCRRGDGPGHELALDFSDAHLIEFGIVLDF